MKKSLAATLILLSASTVHAGTPTFVNADGSELSARCIALLAEGRVPSSFDPEARELRCNGLPVRNFVLRHLAGSSADLAPAAVSTPKPARPERVVFRPSDSSPETELCFAAITSPISFKAAQERHPDLARNLESELRCNDLPFKTFVKRYAKSAEITASL